jgi:NitT/TauT family transport system substrate-binding protein
MRLPASRSAPVRGGRAARRDIGRVAAAALAVTLLGAGCQAAGSGAGSPGAAGSPQLTVAASPGVANVPLYLAASEGLFKKAGLRVTIQSYDSSAREMKALRAGTADVASADYADYFFAASSDPSLRILADGYDAAPSMMEVLALPGANIARPQDLVGKTIGTPEPQAFPYSPTVPYSLDTMATQSVLLGDGVEPTQVKWRALPAQDLIGALKGHQVNAILVTEPYIFQAESQLGATEVLDSLSGATASIPLDGYFTTRSATRAKASALRTFRSVLLQAQAQAASGRSVRSALAHYPQMNVQTAAMITLGVYPTSLNTTGLQQVANLMYSFGMISQALGASSMIFH